MTRIFRRINEGRNYRFISGSDRCDEVVVSCSSIASKDDVNSRSMRSFCSAVSRYFLRNFISQSAIDESFNSRCWCRFFFLCLRKKISSKIYY